MNRGNGPRNWRSGCGAVVVPKQSAESFAAFFDGAGVVADFVARINQQVFQPLMISFLVIMRFEFAKRLVQSFTTNEHEWTRISTTALSGLTPHRHLNCA